MLNIPILSIKNIEREFIDLGVGIQQRVLNVEQVYVEGQQYTVYNLAILVLVGYIAVIISLYAFEIESDTFYQVADEIILSVSFCHSIIVHYKAAYILAALAEESDIVVYCRGREPVVQGAENSHDIFPCSSYCILKLFSLLAFKHIVVITEYYTALRVKYLLVNLFQMFLPLLFGNT